VEGVIQWITVKIYSNVPDPDPGNPNTYSHPGDSLWVRTFDWNQFTVVSPAGFGQQGFYIPLHNEFNPMDHIEYQQINIENIQDPFVQQQGQIYWLGIYAYWQGTQNAVGWKTADVNAYPDPYTGSPFMDNGVWWNYIDTTWYPLYDPITQESMDLAFVITGPTGPPPIPTLTEWGMIIFGLVLVGFITWVFLREGERQSVFSSQIRVNQHSAGLVPALCIQNHWV